MTKKWIAINLLLLAVAGLLARQLYVSVNRFNAESDLAKIQPVQDVKQKMIQEKPLPNLPPPGNYVPGDFAVVAEKNVFTESRSKEETIESAGSVEVPPLTPKPILVGVTLSGSQQTAAIIDPSASSSQGQTRRAQIKRVGDFYRGYRITSIDLDRIVLESGTRREIIPLHEGSKRARGGKTSILATRVVPIGSGGGSGSIAVSIVPGGGGTGRASAAPARAPAAAAASQPAGVQTTVVPPRPAAVAVQEQAPAAQEQAPVRTPLPTRQQQTPSTGGTDASRGRVVRTPFGDIVRPNKN